MAFLKRRYTCPNPLDPVSSNKNQVCRLHKAIYGLKQAPRAWFDKLKATLLSFNFSSRKCDPSLFVFSENASVVYILVYVDAIIITGNNKTHSLTWGSTQFFLKDLVI